MNDELVKRLRNRRICIQQLGTLNDYPLLGEAADAIEELQKRVPKVPHGRLIDADEFLKRAIGTKCFHGDYALMLEELVGESTTIIPAEEGE